MARTEAAPDASVGHVMRVWDSLAVVPASA